MILYSAHATSLVQAYWDKQATPARNSLKRKAIDSPAATPSRRTKISTPTPAKPTPRSTKQTPQSAKPSARAGREQSTSDDDDKDIPLAESHTDDVKPYLDEYDWDSIVSQIDNIEQGPRNRLTIYLTMWVDLPVALGPLLTLAGTMVVELQSATLSPTRACHKRSSSSTRSA